MDVFLRLRDCRIGRVFFHLTMLIFLLALLLSWGHSCRISTQVRSLCGTLFAETGSLRFTPDGIRTTRNPDRKQSYLLDDRLRWVYYPGTSLAKPDMKSWDTPFGLVVMDNGIVFWVENHAAGGKGKDYMIAPLTLDQQPMQTETIRAGLTAEEFYHYLKTRLEHRSGPPLHFVLPEADEKLVSEYLITCFSLMIFIGSLLTMLLLMAGTVFFFFLLHYLWFLPAARRPPVRQTLALLIYLAFPALSAASLYSFIMVPLIAPHTVFFVVYFIYYMIVSRKIRQEMNPPGDFPADNNGL